MHTTRTAHPRAPRLVAFTDDQLRLILEGAAHLTPPSELLIMLLAMTGQRLGELLDMTWSELDFEAGLWRRSPVGKNRFRPFPLPLHPIPLHALQTIATPPINRHGPVFPAAALRRDSTLSQRTKIALTKILGADAAHLADWVMHDFRRTFAKRAFCLGHDMRAVELTMAMPFSESTKFDWLITEDRAIEMMRKVVMPVGDAVADLLPAVTRRRLLGE